MKKAKIIIANWKMNFLLQGAIIFCKNILLKKKLFKNTLIICPPTSLIYALSEVLKKKINLGAQDCHYENFGPYTGDISPPMLKNIGCKYVIIGHSERRIGHYEDNALIKKKIDSLLKNNLIPILCIGESLKDKKQNRTYNHLLKQLRESLPKKNVGKKIIIAYEPIWSIGSGTTPKINEISKTHSYIKSKITKIHKSYSNTKIVYGGSVNDKNSNIFLKNDNVDGLLVGGASTNYNKLLSILLF